MGRGASIAALLGGVVGLIVASLAFAAAAGAQTDTVATIIPGNPLTVDIGPRGQCQSSYQVNGELAGNFYLGSEQVGDCGFFLAFPKAGSGQPVALGGKTFGWEGRAGPGSICGPGVGSTYEKVSQSAVSGLGTVESPYTQTTVFSVKEGTVYAEIVEVTTYVNGAPQFTSTYTVKNVSSGKLYFRAIYAGDLYINGNDAGTGVFLGGPPRFIGGQNNSSGIVGGFQEVTPWSAYQEAYWCNTSGFGGEGITAGDNGIWHDVETTVEQATAFNNSIEPLELDNGAGVEWDQYRTVGLEKGAEASFTIINRTQIPSGLKFGPVSQTLTQGQTATISASAVDTAGQPYAGKMLRYTVTGANPQSGAVTLNSSGSAQISYVGNNPGIDTIQMYVDLGNTGSQTTTDPSGIATVTFLPKPAPPTPNASYKVQSIKANSNGTITIVFVPVQGGTATLEVTVPTATITKKKKCKKGLVRIKGKCLPPTSTSGRVSATGIAGVPLALTVGPSGKVKKALKKGRTVVLTATLTYHSALGGAPVVQTFRFTIKPPKKHKKH